MYLFGTYGDQGQNKKGEQKDSIGEFLRLGCSTRKLVYKVFGKLLSAGTTEDISKDAFLRTWEVEDISKQLFYKFGLHLTILGKLRT